MSAVATEGALAVRGLEVRYHGALALGDINLAIPRGARVGIVGRNGAGKSSLLRAIAGIVPCASGTIEWDGVDITRLRADRRVRQGIAMIPEGRRVFGGLSVANNLRVGGFVDGKHVGERLNQVHRLFPILKERAQLPAGQLSGGEAQMLAIGEALMSGPRLLLLDEPTEGVWIGVIEEITERLVLLAKEIAVVIVEQHLDLALEVASHAYVLDRGRVALVGSAAEVRHDPRLLQYLSP